MTKQDIRNMVINLLNDEHGVNALAYDGLNHLCVENNWNDIISAVGNQDGRVFLHEDDAENLLQIKVIS